MSDFKTSSGSRVATTRRGFVSAAASTAFAFTLVPRHVLGGPGYVAPSEQLQVAGIGAGGMGGGDIATVSKLGANYVALCDVDETRAAGTFAAHPRARRYKDFREMLDKEAANIDAVTVGTPDHIHAVASMAAIKAGKHVYCQKPLTHTLFECRELTKAAKAAGVMTSMGNQGHASEGARLTNEWIQAGVIGDVREVHVSSSDKIEKMEQILLEKNRMIERLQGQVEAERSHRLKFENVKTILDEEISRLQEQVRHLKTERESQNA